VLEQRGIRCWIVPRDITPGADWGEAIVNGIQQSRAFVLVFSGHANESQQIKREVEHAVSRGVPIIPLRIENVVPAKSLEYFLSTPHWLDAFTPPLEQHLSYLADVLRHILDGAGVPPKPKPPPKLDRRLVVAGAVAGALVLGLIGWWLFGASQPPSFTGTWTAEKVAFNMIKDAAPQSAVDLLAHNALDGPERRRR
jgi:hypothetical protein